MQATAALLVAASLPHAQPVPSEGNREAIKSDPVRRILTPDHNTLGVPAGVYSGTLAVAVMVVGVAEASLVEEEMVVDQVIIREDHEMAMFLT